MGWFKKLFELPARPRLADSDAIAVEKALVGKTIEHVTQVCIENGWFVIYLKMTDGSSIHFISISRDYRGCIRVQLDNLDGTKSHLPVIPKGD